MRPLQCRHSPTDRVLLPCFGLLDGAAPFHNPHNGLQHGCGDSTLASGLDVGGMNPLVCAASDAASRLACYGIDIGECNATSTLERPTVYGGKAVVAYDVPVECAFLGTL